MTQNSTVNKRNNRYIEFHQNYKLLSIKEHQRESKIQPTEWETMFAGRIPAKSLISRVHTNHLQLNNKETNNQLINGQRTKLGPSPKKTYKWHQAHP